MKTIFSNFVVTLLVLLVAQTVSAIPNSATQADSSALSTQPTSSQGTGSSLHSAFRSIQNFSERYVTEGVTNEAFLISAGDALETAPVTMATMNTNNGLFTIEGFSSESVGVNVSEPSLVALLATGLVAIGFVYRMKNNQ